MTEKDLMTKVVAEDRLPSEVRVEECMTSPLVTVEPYQEVVEAARTMAELRIRRLPVVDGENLVGLITENDVLKVWPALIENTRQRAEIATQGEGNGVGLLRIVRHVFGPAGGPSWPAVVSRVWVA